MADRKIAGWKIWTMRLGVVALAGVIGLHVTRLVAREPAPATPFAAAPMHPIVVSPAKLAGAPLPKPVAARAPSSAQPANSPDDAMTIKRVLTIDGPFRHGDYVWDDAGVPPGKIVITVDLAAQTLSVFRGGYEIGAAVVLYGADNKPTPLGTFTITQKDRTHVSNLYDAPMPYMLRLTNDGISIHGTKSVSPDEATHGCVGVPMEFAAKLFAQAKLGDMVIVTRGKMLNVGAAKIG